MTKPYHLRAPCPVCRQGSSLVFAACPACSHLTLVCDEERSTFAIPKSATATLVQVGPEDEVLCGSCKTTPVEDFVPASLEQIHAEGLERSDFDW